MTPAQKRLQTITTPAWVLLPLRLFLGVTFIYAGVQKIMDPQFFNPQARGYIGKQIAAFALNTPLHGFLAHVAAPHATLFGLLVILGELAIGVGTLFGLLLRPAAFFGCVLSLLFFLSASWHVYPYFYGADIVFAFCWLTLLLNGPLNTGYPSLDAWLTMLFLENAPPQRQTRLFPVLAIVLGTLRLHNEEVPTQTAPLATKQAPQASQARLVRNNARGAQRALDARRNFLLGMLTGGAAAAGIAAFGYAINVLRHGDESAVSAGTGSGNAPLQGLATPQDTATAGGTAAPPSSGNVIAQVSAVPGNSAVNFTIPSSGDAGVLVHLDNGQFVAYDALCTHAGCQVDYDPSSKLLICPCHGAAFDPAKAAQVVNPPANTPLGSVSIHVDSATGAITLAS